MDTGPAHADPERRPAGAGWLAWALAGLAIVAAVLVLRAWSPAGDTNATVCVFRRLTHHDCATCGSTRAMALLARGDVSGAFARHPLVPPLALELVLLWLAAPFALVRRWWPPGTWTDRWLLAHAGAFLVLWVARLLA